MQLKGKVKIKLESWMWNVLMQKKQEFNWIHVFWMQMLLWILVQSEIQGQSSMSSRAITWKTNFCQKILNIKIVWGLLNVTRFGFYPLRPLKLLSKMKIIKVRGQVNWTQTTHYATSKDMVGGMIKNIKKKQKHFIQLLISWIQLHKA